jgi:hypothetical protein
VAAEWQWKGYGRILMHELWRSYSLRFMATKADVNAILFFSKQGFHMSSDGDGELEVEEEGKDGDPESGARVDQNKNTKCPHYLLNELRKFPETNSQLMAWQTGVAPPIHQ